MSLVSTADDDKESKMRQLEPQVDLRIPTPRRQGAAWGWVVLRLTGAGLLGATGAIHLDLYLTGYRTLPTIGWLFLLQVIAAFGLGLVVLVAGRGLPALAGAAFVLSTLGGYLLSLRIGLFNFREVGTTAGIVAGTIEVVAFAVLVALALGSLGQPRPSRWPAPVSRLVLGLKARIAVAYWTSAALTTLAAVLLGVSLAATGPPTSSAASANPVLKIATINGVEVVTNARGFTLYWFVTDTPTKSVCYDTCALYWPPVIGRPVASARLTAKLGTVKRSGGMLQATYKGHPLYTYVGDSGPGQATGNDINLNGGLWHQMDVSG